ncbi:homoserine O-acetyltransferase, partial [Metarhizium brunneum ARSEF 3297]
MASRSAVNTRHIYKALTRPTSARLIGLARIQNAALSSSPRAKSGAASNPAMAFPCLDALETKSATLQASRSSSGPEPSYTSGPTETFHCKDPLLLDWGGILPEFTIAYESWGAVNADKSNVILLHTGLSASSHAHSTEANPQPGWWEKFIGPGAPLDTNKYHVICTNVIGGCHGSTGPSSIDPGNGERYATRFPILTMQDMVRAQFRLLDHLGVDRLHASVGSSMGGMQSLAAGVLFPQRVGRIHRHAPHPAAGPHDGPQLEPRLLLRRRAPARGHEAGPREDRRQARRDGTYAADDAACSLTLPPRPYEEQPASEVDTSAPLEPASSRPPEDLVLGLAALRDTPTLVLGVASDILFPAWQQREIAQSLRLAGNRGVTHVELSEEMSLFGHDTFLLDLEHVGGNVRMFLN